MKFYIAALIAALSAVASANVATFDGFSEGFALSYTDDGITFSNLDQYLGDGPHDNFTIDEADQTLGGMAGFSPNNVLSFGGYAPGPSCAFSRLGTFDFSTGGQASGASMDIFSFANDPNTSVTLQGLLGGAVVNSASVTLPADFVVEHSTLTLGAGTYDSFRVVSSSNTNQGASFLVLDNVSVAPVPEPTSLIGLAAGAAALIRRRAKKSR